MSNAELLHQYIAFEGAEPAFLTWLEENPRANLRRLWQWGLPSEFRVWLAFLPCFLSRDELLEISSICVDNVEHLIRHESQEVRDHVSFVIDTRLEAYLQRNRDKVRKLSQQVYTAAMRALAAADHCVGKLNDAIAQWLIEYAIPDFDPVTDGMHLCENPQPYDAYSDFLRRWRELPEVEARRTWAGYIPSRWRVAMTRIRHFMGREQLTAFATFCLESAQELMDHSSRKVRRRARLAALLYKEVPKIETEDDMRKLVRRISNNVMKARWYANNCVYAFSPIESNYPCDDMAAWLIENVKPNFDLT